MSGEPTTMEAPVALAGTAAQVCGSRKVIPTHRPPFWSSSTDCDLLLTAPNLGQVPHLCIPMMSTEDIPFTYIVTPLSICTDLERLTGLPSTDGHKIS